METGGQKSHKMTIELPDRNLIALEVFPTYPDYRSKSTQILEVAPEEIEEEILDYYLYGHDAVLLVYDISRLEVLLNPVKPRQNLYRHLKRSRSIWIESRVVSMKCLV